MPAIYKTPTYEMPKDEKGYLISILSEVAEKLNLLPDDQNRLSLDPKKRFYFWRAQASSPFSNSSTTELEFRFWYEEQSDPARPEIYFWIKGYNYSVSGETCPIGTELHRDYAGSITDLMGCYLKQLAVAEVPGMDSFDYVPWVDDNAIKQREFYQKKGYSNGTAMTVGGKVHRCLSALALAVSRSDIELERFVRCENNFAHTRDAMAFTIRYGDDQRLNVGVRIYDSCIGVAALDAGEDLLELLEAVDVSGEDYWESSYFDNWVSFFEKNL